MHKICPSECPTMIESGAAVIIDIMEQFEFDAVNISSLHIPMAELENHLDTVRKYNKVIVMCQSGRRAEALVNFLETEYNVTNLLCMEGGILGWKEKVDPSLIIE